MKALYKLILLFFTVFMIVPNGYSQKNADLGIGILMIPASVELSSTGILSATVGNYGNGTIVSNSVRVTISVGSNAEIIGIAAGSDVRWSQMSLTTGSGNTIKLTNTGGGFISFDASDILLIVRGNVVSGATGIAGNIVYIARPNTLLCAGCTSTPQNVFQGNASNSNVNSETSLAILMPNALPIDLLSFSGECLSNQIRLNWETASESNNDYFSVERSSDGINWTEIGTINAAGNATSSRKYFLDDVNKYSEISYYKLIQHDFSGVSRSFSPISVKNCFTDNVLLPIFPNPAHNAININFNGDSEQVTNTAIFDLFGRQIYQSAIYQSAVNIEIFEDGIYFLQIILKSGSITRQFIIAK
jgi:hypothetical protein